MESLKVRRTLCKRRPEHFCHDFLPQKKVGVCWRYGIVHHQTTTKRTKTFFV